MCFWAVSAKHGSSAGIRVKFCRYLCYLMKFLSTSANSMNFSKKYWMKVKISANYTQILCYFLAPNSANSVLSLSRQKQIWLISAKSIFPLILVFCCHNLPKILVFCCHNLPNSASSVFLINAMLYGQFCEFCVADNTENSRPELYYLSRYWHIWLVWVSYKMWPNKHSANYGSFLERRADALTNSGYTCTCTRTPGPTFVRYIQNHSLRSLKWGTRNLLQEKSSKRSVNTSEVKHSLNRPQPSLLTELCPLHHEETKPSSMLGARGNDLRFSRHIFRTSAAIIFVYRPRQ